MWKGRKLKSSLNGSLTENSFKSECSAMPRAKRGMNDSYPPISDFPGSLAVVDRCRRI